MFMSYAWAQAATGGSSPSLLENLIPYIGLIFIFYFLLIRPSQKRQRAHESLLAELKRGDSVLTSGGILGTIEGLTDQIVILQIAEGVKIRVLRSQISSKAVEELEKK